LAFLLLGRDFVHFSLKSKQNRIRAFSSNRNRACLVHTTIETLEIELKTSNGELSVLIRAKFELISRSLNRIKKPSSIVFVVFQNMGAASDYLFLTHKTERHATASANLD